MHWTRFEMRARAGWNWWPTEFGAFCPVRFYAFSPGCVIVGRLACKRQRHTTFPTFRPAAEAGYSWDNRRDSLRVTQGT